MEPGTRNEILRLIGRNDKFTITHDGEVYTGPRLEALLRGGFVGIYQGSATRLWGNIANDVAMAYTARDWEELGYTDWDSYTRLKFGRFIGQQSVSSMVTWVTRVVPRLKRLDIDPTALTDVLSPSAMESLVPLLAPEEYQGKGRKSAIADRTDTLVHIICAMVIGAELETEDGDVVVLNPTIKTHTHIRSLKSNTAFTHSSTVLELLEKAGFDPIDVYTAKTLDELHELGTFIVQRRLSQLPPDRAVDLLTQYMSGGADVQTTTTRPVPTDHRLDDDDFSDDDDDESLIGVHTTVPHGIAEQPQSYTHADHDIPDEFDEDTPDSVAPSLPRSEEAVRIDPEFEDDTGSDTTVMVIDADPPIEEQIQQSTPILLRALGFKSVQFNLKVIAPGEFIVTSRLPLRREDLTMLVELGFPVYKDDKQIIGNKDTIQVLDQLMDGITALRNQIHWTAESDDDDNDDDGDTPSESTPITRQPEEPDPHPEYEDEDQTDPFAA